MNKLLIFIAFLLSLVVTGFISYQYSEQKVKQEYLNNIPKDWKSFVKETHFKIAVKGEISEKGDKWKIIEGRKEYLVLELPDMDITKGNEFSANNYSDWKIIKAHEVNIGDEVLVSGYMHSTQGYVIPILIFVFNK